MTCFLAVIFQPFGNRCECDLQLLLAKSIQNSILRNIVAYREYAG